MIVKDLLVGPVRSVREGERIEVAARMMRDHDVGVLPVIDEHGLLAGVVTDRDLVVRILARGRAASRMRVREVMTTEPFVTCRIDDDTSIASSRMAKGRVSRIIVTDAAERVVGILSLSDLATRADEGAFRVLRAVATREASRT